MLRIVPIGETRGTAGLGLAFFPDGQRWISAQTYAAHLARDLALENSITASSRIVGLPQITAAAVFLPPFELVDGKLIEPFLDLSAKLGAGLSMPPRSGFILLAAAVSTDGNTMFAAGRFAPPQGIGASAATPRVRSRLLAVRRDQSVTLIHEEVNSEGPDRLATSPHRLAAAASDLRLYDLEKNTLVASLEGHTGKARALAFSKDGTRLASGGADGNVFLWDAKTGDRQASEKVSEAALAALAFSPDGKLIAVTGWDKQLRILDAHNLGRTLGSFSLPSDGAALAFSPDGHTLRVAVGDAHATVLALRIEP